jgi:cytochrome c biogenesis protein CcmG, thiol:disulfide interchange protein DsbE
VVRGTSSRHSGAGQPTAQHSGSEPTAQHIAAEPSPPSSRPWPGRLRSGRRPSAAVTTLLAACVAIIAAVIAIDATSHRPAKRAAEPLAPGFSLPSLRDPARRVSLNAYRGHPLIVNFFASWCGPCQRETPLLAKFYDVSRGSVVIIGVDADDSAPAALRFVKAEGVAYPVAFESTPGITNAYGVSEIGIPETFFLDSRHRIVKRILGDVTMQGLTEGVALMDGGKAHALAAALPPGAAPAQDRS